MVNNKKGKAFINSYENLISINSIMPGSEYYGVRLAKEFWETLDIKLGLIIFYNFTLGKIVPCRGTLIYITGVIP